MRVTEIDIEKVKSVRENRSKEGFPVKPELLQEVSTDVYTDPDFFQKEKEKVFRRTWQIAGRVSQIGEPGTYFVHTLPHYSLLFTRDRQGILHGFLNVCRHRGCELAVGEGKARNIACRYHAWVYDLSGQLIGVPEEQMFPGLDKSSRGLVPISVDQWGGFLWYNIDDHDISLESYLGEVWGHTESFPFESCQHLASRSKEVQCNWKLAVDNFNEIYHLAYVHEQTAGPLVDWKNEIVESLGRHTRFFHGFAFESARDRSEELISAETKTAGQRAYENLDAAAKQLQYTYQIFPNAFIFPAGGHLILLRIYPLAIDKCRMDFDHFGFLPENEYEEKVLKDRLDFYDTATAEDFILLPDMQRGVQSNANPTMKLGYLEYAMFNFYKTLESYVRPKG